MDLTSSTPVTTPPGAWHVRIGDRTGWPGVNMQYQYR